MCSARLSLSIRHLPPLTNHSIRATSVTVLSAANYESRHIKAITGHQSEASIETGYSNTPTFHQFKAMSNAIADFADSGCSSADPSASLVAESTGMTASSSSIHSSLASPDENIYNVTKSVEIQQSRKNSQHLVHGLIPGGTFHGCTFNFTVNLPGSSSATPERPPARFSSRRRPSNGASTPRRS